ncbi:MAG: DUF2752 domain-containing protein [Bacteroidia bacterium]
MKRRKILGIAGAIIALAMPLFLLHSDGHIETSQSLCPFKMLTGFPCPGCGLTKSMVFLYEGDFSKSISYHMFGPAFVFFCICAIFFLSLELITKREYFRNILFNVRVGYAAGILLGIYHISRVVYFVMHHSFADILKESIWQ